MYKSVIVILLLVSVCLAQDELEVGRRRHRIKHKYHSLKHSGYLYYLAFIALKVKIVFLIGTMITFAMFAAKMFAFLKYSSLLGNQKAQTREPEKIYIQADSHPSIYSASPEVYDTDSYSEHSYGRDLGEEIFDNTALFSDVIKRLDLNEYAFDSMDIQQESCRKRFICEADFKARSSKLLALGMYIFSDKSLDKYRSSGEEIKSLQDCVRLNPTCLAMR